LNKALWTTPHTCSVAVVGLVFFGAEASAAVTDKPQFVPAPGTYTTSRKITLSDNTAGAVIYYTTDGSTPTTSSAQYSAPIEVSATTTLEAIAVASGDTQSAISSGTYSIARPTDQPTFVPAPGTYTTPQKITISDQTAGALIYYTTDGSTPTTSSTEYTAPVEVDATAKIKAIAVASGHSQSGVSSGNYTIDDYSVVLQFDKGRHDVANGQCPAAALIQGTDGNFYGTTRSGGPYPGYAGVVFQMTPDGMETVLHTFGDAGDGKTPEASLIQGSDGNFYGTTSAGGAYAGSTDTGGTVFTITPDGVETVLHSFGGAGDGVAPAFGLILGNDGNFYGTTQGGGAYGNGTVFKITSAGVETVLYSFSATPAGTNPQALILASDGNFYGATYMGGAYGNGMIFKLTPAGVGTVLYSFSGTPDGNGPDALVQGSDGNFYGTTEVGGANSTCLEGDYGCGTVFKVTPAGVETVLHSFGGTGDGVVPEGLIQGSDGNFYGTTDIGGKANVGTVFEITPTGVETVLHSIGYNRDQWPEAGLVQSSDGNFYGTTCYGGVRAGGDGVVFKLNWAQP
jgi:uncharacterized repeat protein (TIGR03803 family)